MAWSKDEKTILLNALDQALQSAKRQQKGRHPAIQAAFEQAANVLEKIKIKVQDELK